MIYLLFIGVTYFSFAQNKQLLYGFSDIPQALLVNPGGKVTNDWYAGIPFLSHLHVNAGTSGPTVYDLFAKDGLDFNMKLETAIYSMNSSDFFSANEQLELFSGGFAFGNSYEKTKYLSFGLYQELDFIAYFPKDYAILAFEGNQNNINRVFRASDFNASAELISVLHVGYNEKVNTNFTFGVRGKIYSSLVNINATKNRGYFVTQNGINNFYDHIFNLDLEVKTAGLASLTNNGSNTDSTIKTLKKRVLFGPNLGLGFDVGFTYQLTKQWSLDASLLDVGFIQQSKDVENYKLKGNYVFEGVNPLFPETGTGQTAEDYWNNIKGEFKDLFQVDTTNTKYITWRPVKFNASLNYSFGKKKVKECNCLKTESDYQNRVGMQLYAIKRPKQPQLALTAYYYRSLFKGMQVKAAYTIDSYSFSNLGLGVSANVGNINFYVMADNFLQYQNIYNAQSVSLQLGFNYIFKKNEN
ncbi:DUF5723 family protein [Yeosuana sp.]|uniref:DUF5723 family protein n=1 Tax=Yeosuana sp. TaxID=2529388 RepID=UPI0040550CD6